MKITLWILLVLINFVKMIQVDKEYDDPSSVAYEELKTDYKRFTFDIIRTNFQRPGAYFLLKPSERSCQDRCQETRDASLFCHCDQHCALYQDCCIDYWQKCGVSTKPYNSSSQRLWQCVDTTYKRPSIQRIKLPSISYMMITHCSTYNCTNTTELSDSTPVTGDDGKVYRNRDCATCHGVDNITFWGFQIFCPSEIKNQTSLQYNSKVLHTNCTWYYASPNATTPDPCTPTRLCDDVIKTPESAKYKDLVNKCKSYMQIVYSGGAVYKNFHCASCNGINVTQFFKPPIQIKLPSLAIFFDYRPTTREKENGTQRVNRTSDEHDVIGGYLTTIGLSLSIFCLILVLITYVWFPKLRTVPGLVLIALAVSLISYQALLLATLTATSQACKAVAILLHIMILSAFAWMTIMSYDVTKTFAMQGGGGMNASKSAFRRYLIIAFTIPLTIVALSFILGETKAMDVGYGDSDSCWITGLWALILFFYIPVGIMLLFNTVALVWTMLSIRKVTKLTKNVQKSVTSDTRGQNVKIYSKLSTVMGVTWFLGFGVSHSTVVSYLYIIMNSLQGVFIFITFVLNKRTIKLWRYNASTRGDITKMTSTEKKSRTTSKMTSPSASTIQLNGSKGERDSKLELCMTNMEK